MAQNFPLPVNHLATQDLFGGNEVGLNHPNRNSFVRLYDNGDIGLTAAEGVTIYMSAPQRSITFMADQVKFLTKDDGFRWNRLSFNKDAYQYQQPTFFQIVDDDAKSLYRGVEPYLSKDQSGSLF